MTSKKLGALLRSVPPATARAEASPPIAAARDPAPDPQSSRPVLPDRGEPEVPLQVLIPERVRKGLAVKAAEEGRSLRAMVLTAIRSLGVEVTDEEIRGKRGRKHINL
jgi:hypothetical protein